MLFTPGDAVDLARAIRELHASPRLQKRLVREAARVNESYRWPRQRERYEQIVETLLSSPSGRRAAAAAPGGLGRWR
jgi:glycosyltransferase involved in cell wall biosynthesis